MFKFNNKKLLILVAIASSIITFIFFIISKNMMVEEKLVLEEINVYEIAKEEAIKLGRLEPDEKEIIKILELTGKSLFLLYHMPT